MYELSKPTEVVVKTENGQILDLRIPSPLPQPNEALDIHAVSVTEPPRMALKTGS